MHWIIDTFYLHADRMILTLALISLPFIYFYGRRYQKECQQAAFALGLKQLSRRDFRKYLDKFRYTCLNPRTAPVSMSNYFKGIIDGYQVCIFLLMPPGRRSGIGNTALHVRLDSVLLPKFIIRPATFTDELSEMFGHAHKDIDFSSHSRFADQYIVRGEDEIKIRTLLNPSVINVLSQIDGLCIESLGNEILVYKDYSMADPSQYKAYITRAINLVKGFTTSGIDPQLPSQFIDKTTTSVKKKKLRQAVQANFLINAFAIFIFLFGHGGTLGKILSMLFVIEGVAVYLFLKWQIKLLDEEMRHEST